MYDELQVLSAQLKNAALLTHFRYYAVYDALKDKRDKVTHVYIGGVFLSLRVLN